MRGGKRLGAGKAPRLYPCFGEMITIKEAADRLYVSVATLRIRLKEYGDNMEEVFNFYRRKEELWMEKQEKTRAKEQIAAEKIAKMLFDAEDENTDKNESAEITCTSIGPDKIAEAVITPEPKPQQPYIPQPAQVSDRKALRAYNRAIRALGALSVIEMEDRGLAERVKDVMQDLIGERSASFGYLVDWDKLAAETEEAK